MPGYHHLHRTSHPHARPQHLPPRYHHLHLLQVPLHHPTRQVHQRLHCGAELDLSGVVDWGEDIEADDGEEVEGVEVCAGDFPVGGGGDL